MCLGFSVPAYADVFTESPSKNVLYTFEPKSEKELKEFLEQLEASNKRSKELWEKAVKQAESEKSALEKIESNYDNTSIILSDAAPDFSEASTSIRQPNGVRANLGAYVSYRKQTSPLGYNTFGEIYSINV